MKQFLFFSAALTCEAVQIQLKDGSFNTVKVYDRRQPAVGRTFKELEDLAVQMFNDDPEVQQHRQAPFSKETWANMFMNYGCYCNQQVVGGGSPPTGDDANDDLCNALYKCYKCINIDYNHTGNYAAEEMVYQAFYNSDENDIRCTDDFHDEREECPFNICQCDRKFIHGLLNNYKDCISGHDMTKCHNEALFLNDGFDRRDCFGEPTTVINDQCCGSYPTRRPYNATRHECCDNEKLRQPGTC